MTDKITQSMIEAVKKAAEGIKEAAPTATPTSQEQSELKALVDLNTKIYSLLAEIDKLITEKGLALVEKVTALQKKYDKTNVKFADECDDAEGDFSSIEDEARDVGKLANG
jgi:hypothetical protein